MRRDDFSGRVGETFTATAEDGRTLALTLREFTVHSTTAEAFSLEFTDAAQEHVPQQTLRVEHPELGAFPLFVVPLGTGPDGMRYEAIFS